MYRYELAHQMYHGRRLHQNENNKSSLNATKRNLVSSVCDFFHPSTSQVRLVLGEEDGLVEGVLEHVLRGEERQLGLGLVRLRLGEAHAPTALPAAAVVEAARVARGLAGVQLLGGGGRRNTGCQA